MNELEIEETIRCEETQAMKKLLMQYLEHLDPVRFYTDEMNEIEAIVRVLRRCHLAECRALHARQAGEKEAAIAAERERFHARQSAAHTAISAAVSSGALVRPATCSVCGSPHERIIAHHDSYDDDRRLCVRWLCPSCHGKHHAEHGSAS